MDYGLSDKKERKQVIEARRRAEHKRAFRRMIAKARREAEQATIQGNSVRLVVPAGLNPKDYKEAMKARIRAHRRDHGLRPKG